MKTIILVTYDISPYRGSEASVSWNYVSNMRSIYRIIVLFGKGKNEIEKYLKTNKLPNVEFLNIPYVDTNSKGLISDIKYNFNYRRWHYQVYLKAKEIVEQEHVDIIHYLNPIGFKEPGFLWKIKNIPYVWGPIQGVENRPFALYPALSTKGKINAIIRRLVHNGMLWCLPRVRKGLNGADAVFAATPNTQKQLKRIYHKNTVYLPENGIISMERTNPIKYDGGILRLIWIGSVCERKALVILLEALSKLRRQNWHLDVLGDGEQKESLQKKYNYLRNNITWHGMVDRASVQYALLQSHLHIISSLGEGNPTILWEAFGKAIPTLTLDHCGMSGVVCEKCGIKIPVYSYEQVVSDIASKLNEILTNPYIIENLSIGTIECAKKFMWNNRIGLFNDIYNKIIKNHKS